MACGTQEVVEDLQDGTDISSGTPIAVLAVRVQSACGGGGHGKEQGEVLQDGFPIKTAEKSKHLRSHAHKRVHTTELGTKKSVFHFPGIFVKHASSHKRRLLAGSRRVHGYHSEQP